MKTSLHIRTHSADHLAEKVISSQLADDQLKVLVVDFRVEQPDYQRALEQIFEADSIAVW